MKITKAASVELSGAPSAEQLEKINRLTKKAVTAEEVYVFSVRLCDDQVDRDDERFSESCIRELAALFIGKTGVMDHVWSAEKQVARILTRRCWRRTARRISRAGRICCAARRRTG